MNGGSPFSLPSPLTFTYNGVNFKEITTSSGNAAVYLNVDNFTDHVITYPYDTHQMYTNVSGMNNVSFDFYGSSYFAGNDVNVYLLSNSLSELKMAAGDLSNGDISAVYDMISNPADSLSLTLDENGDLSYTFTSLDAGTYCIVIIDVDTGSPLSFTGFEVLDYKLDVNASKAGSYLTIGNDLVDAPSGDYTYTAFLVKDSEYDADIRVNFNGTRSGLNGSINGYPIASTDLMGFAFPTIDTPCINENIDGIFGKDTSLINSSSSNSNTHSMMLDTFQLSSGNYILFTYATSDGDVMGFDEKFVNIYNEHVQLTSD